MYIKFKASQRQMFDSEVFDDATGAMVGNILPDYISEFIDDFENKLKVKKAEAAEKEANAAAELTKPTE
jgi:hypothetical protein